MFQRLFGRERNRNRQIVDALYEQIVAAARREFLYSLWEVPDTPLGRFEMLSLHMFLLQHRLKGETGIAAEIAQELIDEFFKEVDHSIRELGVSDVGVPKRMKKLARMFYGRTAAYAAALDAGDRSDLAAALARNVRPDVRDWPQASALADYAAELNAALRAQSTNAICAGEISFPAIAHGVPNEAEVQP
jgi:cytochrome b pre-mRNA-processing protein 3